MDQSFSRFTERARLVMTLAETEARQLNHNYISTELLLLGLIREGEGIAAGVLESLGVNLEKVRSEVIKVLTQTGSAPHHGDRRSSKTPAGQRPWDRVNPQWEYISVQTVMRDGPYGRDHGSEGAFLGRRIVFVDTIR